jgi:hypothetical protein
VEVLRVGIIMVMVGDEVGLLLVAKAHAFRSWSADHHVLRHARRSAS